MGKWGARQITVAAKYKPRKTYALEVEREGDVSDCGCDYKTRADMTYSKLDVEREAKCQIVVRLQNERRDNIQNIE